MIFLTVGTQLSFDRLVRAVDLWAESRGRSDIFGQICDPGRSGYRPKHFAWTEQLSPPDFQARFDVASAVVAHAGMGTIISALNQAKPLLIMPRRASLKEQRNDHQLATATGFRERAGIEVAESDEELLLALDRLAEAASGPQPAIAPLASPELIAAVRGVILG
ncbi:MAG: hypothetical protein Kilf2KO_06350 [Rhodospirillales bacterium]